MEVIYSFVCEMVRASVACSVLWELEVEEEETDDEGENARDHEAEDEQDDEPGYESD